MEQVDFFFKYKNKILNIALIIVTIIVVYSLYKNQTAKIGSLRLTRDTEIKKNEVLNSIGRLERRIDAYRKIIGRKDISSVINTISNIAKGSNIKIITVKPKAEEKYPVYVKYPFDLMIGMDSYHALGKFISKVEANPNDVFFIDRISIKSTDKARSSEEGQRINANLTISTIVLKD